MFISFNYIKLSFQLVLRAKTYKWSDFAVTWCLILAYFRML